MYLQLFLQLQEEFSIFLLTFLELSIQNHQQKNVLRN